MVVTSAPTSTTNITGFLSWTRGSSFANDSRMAPPRIFGSTNDIAFAGAFSVIGASKNLPAEHHEMLENWTQAERREERQCTDDHDGGNQKCREHGPSHRECSDGFSRYFFLGQIAGNRQ